MFGAQNALSPPLPTPYPYADSYEHLQVKIYSKAKKLKQHFEYNLKQF